MKAALEAMARKAGAIPASERRRIREQGERRALRNAIAEIEKLGIDRRDFARVQACLEAMIADLTD
jgi:hypothetical protein